MLHINGVTRLEDFLAQMTQDDGSWMADLQDVLLSGHVHHLQGTPSPWQDVPCAQSHLLLQAPVSCIWFLELPALTYTASGP